MPGGDRTGPLGYGPMTGRALGFCTGHATLDFRYPRYGHGFGRGLGRGFGRGVWGRGFWWQNYREPAVISQPFSRNAYQTISKDEEKAYLEETIKNLQEDINNLRKRLQELSEEK